LESLGHTLHPVSLPTTQHALPAYYVLAPAEASSNLAKYDGVRYGSRAEGIDGTPSSVLFAKTRGQFLGPEVKRRILLGAFTLSADAIDNYFIQAQKVRRLVSEDFNRVFAAPNPLIDEYEGNEEGVDVLLCPTAPTLPPSLSDVNHQEPLDAYMNDVFTVPASLAGLPAISVPMPIAEEDRNHFLRDNEITETAGMQIIGQFGYDSLVLDVARQLIEAKDESITFEEASDFKGKVNESGIQRLKKKLGVKVPGYGRLDRYPTTSEKKKRKKFGSQAKELGISVDEYIKIHGTMDESKPE
jgi:aspartyl-tRNA(Asn)/glutamyl-tRNA(Gln) amidotransferase subunit A